MKKFQGEPQNPSLTPRQVDAVISVITAKTIVELENSIERLKAHQPRWYLER